MPPTWRRVLGGRGDGDDADVRGGGEGYGAPRPGVGAHLLGNLPGDRQAELVVARRPGGLRTR
ncbi:hypothetical protein [Streptomyces sp. R41]|uniref:Uncharacterized protein n=1 Tax=Streptomyces sp. R41 TaxID=3238632 RepID=A0AB39R8K2_9ACTN